MCIGCCLLLQAKSYKTDALRLVLRGSLKPAGLLRAVSVVPNLSQAHPVQQTVQAGSVGRMESPSQPSIFVSAGLEIATSSGRKTRKYTKSNAFKHKSYLSMSSLAVVTQIWNQSEDF